MNAQEEKAETASLNWAKCERLLNDPDVQWFIAEAIGKPLAEADKTLKDTATAKDAREIAAHVRDALETAQQFLAKRRDIYSRDLPKPKNGA